jgi:glycosyltransferase involved in cell wall biosynthesis
MQALLNILIRTHNRANLFARCLNSITTQNYPTLRVIVSTDCGDTYIPEWCDKIHVMPHPELAYGYDLYINDLKEMVTDGWMIVVDDDDVLAPGCLAALDLSHHAIIVQLNHMGNVLPESADIKPGRIGMPCIILHHSLKDIADVPSEDHNDYWWIKRISEKVELSFQPLVVVVSDRKGNGE